MKNVEDIYPLTPMQELMLLHTVTRRDSDVLFNQFCYTIHGDLNVPAFRGAWQQVVDRHSILRTAFLWGNLQQPHQVVRQRVALPFEQLDRSGLSEADQLTEVHALRAADRARAFVPSQAPLMRLTLVRLSKESHVLIWSSHHLLLDRWCMNTVFDEFVPCYEAACRGRPARLGRPRSFREYVEWIQKQDRSQAQRFWQRTLDGFDTRTLLTRNGDDSNGSEPELPDVVHAVDLPADTTRTIREFAQQNGMTVSTVFHAAWALLINHFTESQDVLFGAVVAGRPPDLPGIESIVGSFINNLPLRVPLPAGQSVRGLLKKIQQQQHERVPFEYLSVGDIQSSCVASSDEPLFDNIVVWLAPTSPPQPAGLEIRELIGGLQTAYPITVTVLEGQQRITVRAYASGQRRTRVDTKQTLERVQPLLEHIIRGVDQPLGELDGFARDLRGEPRVPSRGTLAGPDGQRPSNADGELVATTGRWPDELETLQSMVLTEWEAVLDTTGIGIHNDFFDLGGNSLHAVQLRARLQTLTGKAIPILALFQTPTIARMARLLREQEWLVHSNPVRPIRTRGVKPPLFCVASPSANAVGYVPLLRHLADDQPAYVVQGPPTANDVHDLSPTEVPDVAANYVDAIETVHDTGPVCLIGMCVGAHIAVEMAKQIAAQGKTVAFLGVVDTWSVYTLTRRFHVFMAAMRLKYYAEQFRDLARLGPRRGFARIREVLRRRLRDWEAGLEQTGPRDLDGRPSHPLKNPWDLMGPHPLPLPPKFPGTLTLFRIRKQPYYRARDQQLGWGHHADRVIIEHLPGNDHLAIFRDPQVKALARELTQSLEHLAQSGDASVQPSRAS